MATPQRVGISPGLPPSSSHHSHQKAGLPITPMLPTQYIFPTLKNPEILQCLNELGIDFITKAELVEPIRYKEKIRKLFWKLLENCRGITEEDVIKQQEQSKARTDALSSFSYPDLHENLTDLMFFRELRVCLIICGVADFSLKDLHSPKSKRLRIHLSAIINMAKFREEQLKIYSDLNEPRAELLANLEDLHDEHAQLKEQLGHVQEEANSKLGEMDKVMKECQELEMEIQRNNKLQASKRELATTLKREANDLKDDLASATWALQEAEAEEERLMGQVVSSPTRRTNELKLKQERLDQEKKDARMLEEKMQQTKASIVQTLQATKMIQTTMEVQKQVQEEADKYEHVMGQIDETSKKMNDKVEKTQQINRNIEEAERGWMRTEEKISHMRKQSQMKLQAAQESLDTANQQLRIVEKERREGMARVEAGEAEVRTLEAHMQEQKRKGDQEIEMLIANYKEAESAFLQRNDKRMQVVAASTV